MSCYSSTIPKIAPAVSTQSRFPNLAGKTVASLLAASEELASVLLATSAGVLLASRFGIMLVSIEVAVLLGFDVADAELLVALLDVELLLVALLAATARCEEELAVQAAKDAELVQVVSSVTDPDGVAVGTVA
jgi:hypothetical protein